MNKLLIAALFTAGLATAMPAAYAQTKGPQGTAATQGQHGKRVFRMPSERVEARIAYLQTALKITDAQKPQWDAFANTMRTQARDADKRVMERRKARTEGATRPHFNAVERLEKRQQMLAFRGQQLNTLLATGKPLYASFTPEQKQIADQLLSPRHGRGHGRHHRGMNRGA